jgi:hypothetical protein
LSKDAFRVVLEEQVLPEPLEPYFICILAGYLEGTEIHFFFLSFTGTFMV